jgi:autophagy-related protein 9
MASILLSRLLPPNTSSPSVYETLREHDQLSDTSDIEERAGMTLDEENLGQAFPGHGLNRALEDAAQSQATTESAMLMHHGPSRQQSHGRSGPHRAASRSKTRPKWMQYSRRQLEADEADDEVPASLLIEGDAHPATGADEQPPREPRRPFPIPPVPGPPTREARAQWKTTQVQQRLYHDGHDSQAQRTRTSKGNLGLAVADPKEKALWRWANVENLDNFLKDVYDYFLGNGIWCIMLSRALNLL